MVRRYLLVECHTFEPYQEPHWPHFILLENMFTPLRRFRTRIAVLQFNLNHIEYSRVYNCLVVIFNIVLLFSLCSCLSLQTCFIFLLWRCFRSSDHAGCRRLNCQCRVTSLPSLRWKISSSLETTVMRSTLSVNAASSNSSMPRTSAEMLFRRFSSKPLCPQLLWGGQRQ
jgi:hypothetical protein